MCSVCALSTARVSFHPGAGVAPAWAQTAGWAPAAGKVDIKAAPKDRLKTLPGIGDAYSQEIIDGLPYRGKLDLVHKNIIPPVNAGQNPERKSSRSSRRPPGWPRLPPTSSIASKGWLPKAAQE